MAVFIHESSYIDGGASIGDGTKIWHFCHVLAGTRIGKNCSVGQNCVIGANVRVGDGVKVQNNVSIYEGVEIEDDVFLGPSCVFTNVINPRSFVSRRDEFKKTLIKRGASIGANATIVCGTTIGKYALIGSGAVVTRDIPDFALAVGIPARCVGWVSKRGNRLDFGAGSSSGSNTGSPSAQAIDPSDGSVYSLSNGKVTEIAAQTDA